MARLTVTTPGAGTWTCPAGVYSITLEMWSGGGAGGLDDGTAWSGGGGGGGSWIRYILSVTPGVTYNYYVGAGGVPGTFAPDPPAYGSVGVDRTGRGGGTYFNTSLATGVGGFGVVNFNTQAGADGALDHCNNNGVKGYGGLQYTNPPPTPLEGWAAGNGYCIAGALGGGGGASATSAGAGQNGAGGNGGTAATGGGNGGNHDANGSSPGGGGGGSSYPNNTPGSGGAGKLTIDYPLVLVAGSGSFLLTGASVNFRYWHLQVASGSFALTGSSATLLFNRVLSAGSGSFTLTGTETVRKSEAGSFLLNGEVVTFRRTYAPGNYSNGFPLPPISGGRVPPGLPGPQR